MTIAEDGNNGWGHEHSLEAMEEAQELLERENLQKKGPKASESIEAHSPKSSELNSKINSDGFSANS